MKDERSAVRTAAPFLGAAMAGAWVFFGWPGLWGVLALALSAAAVNMLMRNRPVREKPAPETSAVHRSPATEYTPRGVMQVFHRQIEERSTDTTWIKDWAKEPDAPTEGTR